MRIKTNERVHVLDEVTRTRRQRKALEALEKDNFQDDLPASSRLISDHRMQLNKKFQQRFSVANDADNHHAGDSSLKESTASSTGNLNANQSQSHAAENMEISGKKKKAKPESRLLRFKKTFAALCEEEVKGLLIHCRFIFVLFWFCLVFIAVDC